MQRLLTYDRASRKAVVKKAITTAFLGWEYAKPPNTQMAKFAGQSSLSCLDNFCRWEEVTEDCLRNVYPQTLTLSAWLWLLPSMLLCDEGEEMIGKHPVSLGIPPQDDSELTTLHLDDLSRYFSAQQIDALALYIEMWHWLGISSAAHSHWEAFWCTIDGADNLKKEN